MSFRDIIKSDYLQGISAGNLTTMNIVTIMVITGVLALYIFGVYKVVTRKAFYSKSFNISLVALALITSAIIMTIQSSLVISLGMVGALSIVRFRTAVKEPMDLVFLFWSISVGIICGATLFEIAIVVSIFVSVAIFVLELMPATKAPKLLVVNASCKVSEAEISKVVKQYAKYYKIKAHTLTKQGRDMVYELKIAEGNILVSELGKLEEIYSVSLMSHDGEVTY